MKADNLNVTGSHRLAFIALYLLSWYGANSSKSSEEHCAGITAGEQDIKTTFFSPYMIRNAAGQNFGLCINVWCQRKNSGGVSSEIFVSENLFCEHGRLTPTMELDLCHRTKSSSNILDCCTDGVCICVLRKTKA